MVEHLEIVNAAVSRLVKAALLAARFSEWVRRRSLKRLAAMDTDAKAKPTPMNLCMGLFLLCWSDDICVSTVPEGRQEQ